VAQQRLSRGLTGVSRPLATRGEHRRQRA